MVVDATNALACDAFIHTANELLTEANATIEDLQDQLILVTPELTEAHETLVSQYCNEGRKINDAAAVPLEGKYKMHL